MDLETEIGIQNANAHLCVIEAAVCALIASHPDPAKFSRFFESVVSRMTQKEEFSMHPESRYFEQCLAQLRATLSILGVRNK